MNMKKNHGFTLIELVVVIAILGILAVTALPKFLNLQSDSRRVTMEAMKGTLSSAFQLFSAKAQLPSSEIITSGNIKFLNINGVNIRINQEHYPLFSIFADGNTNTNEPYGLDALKMIVNIDVSDGGNDGSGDNQFNYTFDTNGGFAIYSKIDDYRKSKCYIQYAPDKVHDLIDDLPDGEYFQIVTSGC